MSTSLISRLAHFRRLPPAQRLIFLQAIALLPIVEARLRWGGLKSVRAALERLPVPSIRSPALAREISRLVAAAARHGPLRSKCLATALAVQWMLRKHGLVSELRIGVRGTGPLMAHAWVEHDGVVLIEEPGVHDRFSAFPPVPTAR